MSVYYITKKVGEKLELSKNWKSIKDEYPDYDEIVIVMYIGYSNGYWIHYETTVAKYKDYDEWIDCLNLNNSNLDPLYWRPFPREMD